MDLVKVIKELKQEKTKPYDTTATVTRIEGNTVWVHIPGGVTETPIAQTIDCQAGDRVQVRISGGKAWITGNHSAPPTDDTAANRARTIANTALTAAKKALAGLSYFWTDEEGAHITRTPENEFKQRPEGGNVMINSDGVYLKDGTREMAHFEGTNLSYLNESGIPVFYVGNEGTTGMHIVQSVQTTPFFPRAYFNFPPQGVFKVKTLWTNGEDHYYETFTFDMEDGDIQEQIGSHATVTYMYYDYLTTGTVVNPHVSITGANITELDYDTASSLPYFTLGTRNGDAGAFSATIGENLIAEQGLAVGRYNEDRPDALFAVGAGDDLNRHNVLTVTDDGYVIADVVESDGRRLQTDHETPDITTGTGTLVTSTMYTYGNLVMLKLTIRGTAGAGGNLYTGTLNEALPPVLVTTGSYYGQYAIGASLSSNGDIIIRNATDQSLSVSASNSVTVTLTYIRE